MWLTALQDQCFFSVTQKTQSPHLCWILLCIDRSVFIVLWWSSCFHFHRWGSWPSVWTQMLRHGSASKTSVMVSSPWKVRMCSNGWSPEYAAHGVGCGVALFGHVTAHWCHHYLQVILVPVTKSCCLFAVHEKISLHQRVECFQQWHHSVTWLLSHFFMSTYSPCVPLKCSTFIKPVRANGQIQTSNVPTLYPVANIWKSRNMKPESQLTQSVVRSVVSWHPPVFYYWSPDTAQLNQGAWSNIYGRSSYCIYGSTVFFVFCTEWESV